MVSDGGLERFGPHVLLKGLACCQVRYGLCMSGIKVKEQWKDEYRWGGTVR